MAVILTFAKFMPLICFLIIMHDFCFLPAQFCYIITDIWNVEYHVQITDICASLKISSGSENLVWKAMQQVPAVNSQRRHA
jgi:hypothetical protein